MHKLRNKKIALAMVLMFVFTLVMPLSSYASIEVLTTPTVKDDTIDSLGTVFVDSLAGRMQAGDIVVLTLPEDFRFVNSMSNKDDVMTDFHWNTLTIDDEVFYPVPLDESVDHHVYVPYKKDIYGDYVTVTEMLIAASNVQKSVKVGNKYNYFEFPVKYDGDVSAIFTENDFLKGHPVLYQGSGYVVHTLLPVTTFEDPSKIEKVDPSKIKIEVTGNPITNVAYPQLPVGPDDTRSLPFFVHPGAVYVDKGFEGTVYVDVDAPPGGGFPPGSIHVATVSDGEATVTVEEDCAVTDSGTFTLRFKENVPGAFVHDNDDGIVAELPDGFTFKSANVVSEIWGSNESDPDANEVQLTDYTCTVDGDKARIEFAKESTKAMCIEVEFTIEVDETDAEYGDIELDLSDSETDLDPTSLIVGYYGDYDATIEVEEPTEVIAGMDGQEIGKILIKESVEESMIKGRTVLLTLPENARWDYDSLNKDFEEDENLELLFQGLIGADDRTAKFKVNESSEGNDAAEIYLEEAEVYLEAGETGDLVVEVSGSAGLDGEIVVANVVAPITVEASATPNVKIGLGKQAAGDITITETAADTLIEGEELKLVLPEDVEFAGTPDVEVIEGDLEISDIDVDDSVLTISIDDASKEASTIKISNIYYSLYRTVPEGDIEVSIQGLAVVETNEENDAVINEGIAEDADNYKELFNIEEAATVVNATCGTPAPSDEKLSTSITLGDNGSYLSDGRIMVQLRDAATALGIEEQNILWDGATNSANLIKGDRVVQITVGGQVKLNGVALPTDKGAELKDGRTYVSLSAAGVALGATAEWDNSTKTATLTIE